MEPTDSDPVTDYPDTGCALAPSCLRCPFPLCLEEAPRGRQRFVMSERRHEMLRLYRRGKSTRELAAIFGVSPRTVQRATKGARRAV